jgi:hypothetical protein
MVECCYAESHLARVSCMLIIINLALYAECHYAERRDPPKMSVKYCKSCKL